MKHKHFYDKITGWFDFEAIYDMAVSEAQDGDTFIETGTANGKSVVYLAVEALNSGKDITIVTIDNTQTPSQVDYVLKQTAGLDNVKYINKDSMVVVNSIANESCRMVFLDADHEYDFVSRELEAWYPKVISGGIFAGHDYDNGYPGVPDAVHEFVFKHNLEFELIGSSWLIRKP